MINLFGLYIAFTFKQKSIRNEMAELMGKENREEKTSFVFSKQEYANLLWTRGDKEFSLDGRRYDVLHIEIVDGNVRVCVEEDEKETRIIADFIGIIRQQSEKEQTNSPVKVLLKHLLNEFTMQDARIISYLNGILVGIMPEANSHFLSFISDYQAPPPKS